MDMLDNNLLESPYHISRRKGFSISKESLKFAMKKFKKEDDGFVLIMADAKERSNRNSLYNTHWELYARTDLPLKAITDIFDCLELNVPINTFIHSKSTPEEIEKVRDSVVRIYYQKNIEKFGPVAKNNTMTLNKETLEQAKQCIKDYLIREFGEAAVPVEFSNLRRIKLAERITPKHSYLLSTEVDLVESSINIYINGKQEHQRKYNTLEELVENELMTLNYERLTTMDEDGFKKFQDEHKHKSELKRDDR